MDTLSILLISLVVLLLFGVPVYMVLISSTMISLFVFFEPASDSYPQCAFLRGSTPFRYWPFLVLS